MTPNAPIAMSRPTDSDGSEARERLPRSRRIRLGGEIRALLKEGRRRSGPLVDVFTRRLPEAGASRFGVIVPRHGHTIVERNLLRRRLKEIGRREVLPRLARAKCPADVLVRSKPDAYEASYSILEEALIRSAERLCSERSSSP